MAAKSIYNLIILDESGSMTPIRTQAVSAMNETFQSVRNARQDNPDTDYYISLTVFEGRGIAGVRTVRDCVPVASVEDVRLEEFRPGGCTPLYDAIGVSVNALSRRAGKDDNVIVTIITDGMENASEEFSGSAIRSLISSKRADGWTFAYIGANQDAVEVARDLRVPNALNFEASGSGMKNVCRKLDSAFRRYESHLKEYLENDDMEDLFSDID